MSTTTEDRLILEEFAQWTATHREDVDLSVEAFLKEREDAANERRIAEALTGWDGDAMRAAFDVIEEPTIFERQAIDVLLGIESALVGDRDYRIDRTYTGPTTRTFT